MTNCEKWLSDFLSGKSFVLCDIVRDKAIALGFSKRELKQARKTLGVKCWSDWVANGKTMNWFWYLPEKKPENRDA